MDPNQKREAQELVRQEVKNFYGKKIVGDNPTDALQLVNKRYAITGGPGSVLSWASVLSIDPLKGRLFKVTTGPTVSVATVNASTTGLFGQQLQMLITNESAAAQTLVFASLFQAGSVVGLRSSVVSISFVSDATKFYETARTQGL